jgi:hypothetical protein
VVRGCFCSDRARAHFALGRGWAAGNSGRRNLAVLLGRGRGPTRKQVRRPVKCSVWRSARKSSVLCVTSNWAVQVDQHRSCGHEPMVAKVRRSDTHRQTGCGSSSQRSPTACMPQLCCVDRVVGDRCLEGDSCVRRELVLWCRPGIFAKPVRDD